MSAWDMVLSVRKMIGSRIFRLRKDWRADHLDDMRHECYVALYHAANRFDSSKGSWPTFAWSVIGYTVGDYMRRERGNAELLPCRIEALAAGTDRVELGARLEERWQTYSERCNVCRRALRSKLDLVKRKADRKLEARKHSAGICQACAVREKRRRARNSA